MGSLFSILVIGAVYAVVYVVKSLRATPGDNAGRVFGESFPTIEVLENEQEYVSPVQSASTQVSSPSTVSGRVIQKSSVHTTEKNAPSAPPEKDVKPDDGRLVKHSSKSEAKRAFLYSEIFNRKY